MVNFSVNIGPQGIRAAEPPAVVSPAIGALITGAVCAVMVLLTILCMLAIFGAGPFGDGGAGNGLVGFVVCGAMAVAFGAFSFLQAKKARADFRAVKAALTE